MPNFNIEIKDESGQWMKFIGLDVSNQTDIKNTIISVKESYPADSFRLVDLDTGEILINVD